MFRTTQRATVVVLAFAMLASPLLAGHGHDDDDDHRKSEFEWEEDDEWDDGWYEWSEGTQRFFHHHSHTLRPSDGAVASSDAFAAGFGSAVSAGKHATAVWFQPDYSLRYQEEIEELDGEEGEACAGSAPGVIGYADACWPPLSPSGYVLFSHHGLSEDYPFSFSNDHHYHDDDDDDDDDYHDDDDDDDEEEDYDDDDEDHHDEDEEESLGFITNTDGEHQYRDEDYTVFTSNPAELPQFGGDFMAVFDAASTNVTLYAWAPRWIQVQSWNGVSAMAMEPSGDNIILQRGGNFHMYKVQVDEYDEEHEGEYFSAAGTVARPDDHDNDDARGHSIVAARNSTAISYVSGFHSHVRLRVFEHGGGMLTGATAAFPFLNAPAPSNAAPALAHVDGLTVLAVPGNGTTVWRTLEGGEETTYALEHPDEEFDDEEYDWGVDVVVALNPEDETDEPWVFVASSDGNVIGFFSRDGEEFFAHAFFDTGKAVAPALALDQANGQLYAGNRGGRKDGFVRVFPNEPHRHGHLRWLWALIPAVFGAAAIVFCCIRNKRQAKLKQTHGDVALPTENLPAAPAAPGASSPPPPYNAAAPVQESAGYPSLVDGDKV